MAFPTALIDTAALRHNLQAVRRNAPDSRVVAAIKANGYGHGLIPVARALAHADAFGVARLEEALALRDGGISNTILLLEGVFSPDQLVAAAGKQLELVVHTFEQVAMLEQYSGDARFTAWVKADTGMNRLGFGLHEVQEAFARLGRCGCIERLRLMTHFASAEQPDDAVTRLQLERFAALASRHRVERSIANSAGLLGWPESRVEWVRPGLMLYGISPFAHRSAEAIGLQPAMTLTTQLIAVREVAAGEPIGYGGIWRAQRACRIGVAAIGYGDGYPRGMRAGAPVLVNGREARVAGRVSMDMTMIDVTDLPDAKAGDTVTLWGDGLPAERIASYADTIAYELVCRVTSRVRMEWK